MANIWVINQFANTPDLPGHTRQYEIAIYLSKKNWNINVFASDFNLNKRSFCKLKRFEINKIEFIENIIWHWLRVIPYKKNNWKRYCNQISFCINLILSMLCLVFRGKKEKSFPDIIMASSPQLPATFLSFLFAKLLNIYFVLEVRDLWPQVLIDQGGMSKDNYLIKILIWMERVIYNNSDYVIALAKGSEKYIRKKGVKKTVWLPNGPDLEKFKFSELPSEDENFSFKKPFRILYTGAHGDANDLDNIIDAAILLQNLPIKFILIGDGPLKSQLVNRAKKLKNVQFKKPISKNKIPITIASADAIIVSLKKVNLFQYGVSPNKLYDAYAIGRPLITTIDGDINNEVKKYKLGYTASSSNPIELRSAINKLFNTPRIERARMGIRARKLAEKIYSRQKINIEYEKIFRELLIYKK